MAVMGGVLPHVGAGGCGFAFASMLSAVQDLGLDEISVNGRRGQAPVSAERGAALLGSVMMSVVLLFSHSSSGTVKL